MSKRAESRRMTPTLAAVAAVLDYDSCTGLLFWKLREGVPAWWNTRFAGAQAGTVCTRGYVRVTLDYISYPAHALAWLLTYGDYPIGGIDHEDHDRANNRIANLRLATPAINAKNTSLSARNTSGAVGVHWDRVRAKWKAVVVVGGRHKFLGRFGTQDAAIAARKEAEQRYGFHPNHGVARA